MRLGRICFAGVLMFVGTVVAEAAKKQDAPVPPRELTIEMGAPFHDHAILQQGMKVPVWGWSEPGAEVTVAFVPAAGCKNSRQEKTATAGKDGKWMLELDPLQASFEPAEMVITESNGKRDVLSDILVGEVWMCSGQSNMQFEAKETSVGWKLIPGILARVEAGDEKMPVIREVKVTNKFSSLYPAPRVKGQWSSEWNGFSAIAFAFAYEIARETGVPVGIVNGSFSTTIIQAWVPREGFASGRDAYTKSIYQKILEADYTTPEFKAAWKHFEKNLLAWGKESKARVKKGLEPKERPVVPGNMNGNRDATWMGNAKVIPMAPYAMRGVIWNQGYANINEGLVYRNNLHSLARGYREIWDNPELPIYFNQFYASGGASQSFMLNDYASEMRIGTWLAHKELPHVGMASQIDVVGGVHYRNKTLPGKRLALHALKHQYPFVELISEELKAASASGLAKDLIVNGPMYRDYTVDGNKLILELDHAEGLCVAQAVTEKRGFTTPVLVENGEDQVNLFYLADKELVWHLADMKIAGDKIELTAAGVDAPRGIAYGRIIVGDKPSIYNKALLPLTPFVFYDHKLVVSHQWDLDHIAIPGFAETVQFFPWPMDHFKVAGEVKDPTTYGLQEEYRKLWLLSPQFAENCVIQSGVPTRIYGKAIPHSVVSVKYGDFEQSLTLGEEGDEWEMTVPAMAASAEPKLLHVVCTLDGEIAHERKISNVVVGDVWYVAANDLEVLPGPGVPKSGPASLRAWDGANSQLRMLNSFAQRIGDNMPSRFKLNSSGNPDSSLFARWSPVNGFTKELAERIHARTGQPVGIVVLDPDKTDIKQWTGFDHLKNVKTWQADYDELYPYYHPDPKSYVTNSKRYLTAWKAYWKRVKSDPTFDTGGMVAFPGPAPVETKATFVYNQAISGFSPGNFKAMLCLASELFIENSGSAGFDERFAVMANSWKEAFARGEAVIDPHFVYALPSQELVPLLAQPSKIQGAYSVVRFAAWPEIKNERVELTLVPHVNDALIKIVEDAVEKVYP